MQRAEALRVLRLSPHSSDEEIRDQYRRLVKAVHPDRAAARAVGPRSDVDIARLVEAYRVLAPRRLPTPRDPAPSAGPRRRASAQPQEQQRASAADVVRLGRQATGGEAGEIRIRALEALAESGRYSSVAYIRQALFDHDRDVALAAARAMVAVPGVRLEQELLSMYSQLTARQREAVLIAAAVRGRQFPRLLAYALADPVSAVARRAQEMMA